MVRNSGGGLRKLPFSSFRGVWGKPGFELC
jgi:hypothetical protein